MGSPSTTTMEDYAKPAEAAVPVAEAAPAPAPAEPVAKVGDQKQPATGEPMMDIDSAIALLQEVKAKKGNLMLAVHVFHDETSSWSVDAIAGHYYEVDDAGRAQKLVLCDASTLDGVADNLDLTEEEVNPQGGN